MESTLEEETNKPKAPEQLTLSVIISNKLGKGSIKVSTKDLGRLGVDMVEDVIVAPVDKEEWVSELLFSDSKLKSGFVMVSSKDMQVIGVNQGDKLRVEKKEDSIDELSEDDDGAAKDESSDTEVEETPDSATDNSEESNGSEDDDGAAKDESSDTEVEESAEEPEQSQEDTDTTIETMQDEDQEISESDDANTKDSSISKKSKKNFEEGVEELADG